MNGEPILIVDDNPINLKLEKILLTVEGFDVRTATDAEETIKLLESFHPRLILVDLQLPGMSGLDLVRKLKADPKHKNIILIAVTAYAMKGDREKALLAGCEGYVTKPIDINVFPGIIANYLGLKNLT